ncbi:MAG: DUF3291 domain-containing protein [Anaerolineae bacterium]
MTRLQIAQINVARRLAPLNDPVMAEFVAQLDKINALADISPGFVWRLKENLNDPTSIHVFEDEYILINMSVWESIDTLYQYAYYSAHADVFRKRSDWFSRLGKPNMALWWVPANHQPSELEGKTRLEHLQTHGASAYAFTFKERFDPVEEPTE